MNTKIVIQDNFVIAISNDVGTNASEETINKIRFAAKNKPTDPEGYQYKLRADNLEWELVELPPVEPEPLTDEEALTRYANELTGSNDPDLISAAETLLTERIKEES